MCCKYSDYLKCSLSVIQFLFHQLGRGAVGVRETGSTSPRVRVTTQVLTTLVLAGQSGILIQIAFSYFIISTHIDIAETEAKKSNASGLSLLILAMVTFAVGNICSNG